MRCSNMANLGWLLAITGCTASLQLGKPYCANAGDGTQKCFATKQEREEFWAQQGDNQRAAEKKQADDRQREIAAEDARADEAEEARRAKATREREEREAIVRDREAEEQRRRDSEKQQREELRQLATQKEYAVPIISTMICENRSELTGYEEDLKHERRIEAESGVRDLKARRDIAEGMDASRTEIKEWTAFLKNRYAASPATCAPLHQAISECHRGNSCSDEARRYADVWRVSDDIIVGDN